MNYRDGIIQSGSRRESALASAKFSTMLFEPAHAVCYEMKQLVKPALFLAIVYVCLFGYVLHLESGFFREFQATLLSLQWMLLVCIAVWCGTFLFLTFSLKDLPLIFTLLIAMAVYFISYAAWPALDAIILLAGVTLGKGARVLLRLKAKGEMLKEDDVSEFSLQPSAFSIFLFGLVMLLAFGSLWHLDMSNNFYHGPRWTGLWNNPNDYGLLMGAGVVLAAGLLAERLKAKGRRLKKEMEGNLKSERLKAEMGKRKLLQILKAEKLKTEIGEREAVGPHPDPLPSDGRGKSFLRSFAAKIFGDRRRRGNESGSEDRESKIANRKLMDDSLRRLLLRPLPIILSIAALMMSVGLVMSYSRGAWIATTVGLLYLAKHTKAESGKRKAKIIWFLLPLVALVVAIAVFFWHTPRTAPWYFQRLDLSRGSVQHRLAAWKAGFEMMRDHPFGVGWNKTVGIYMKDYSPPENGAAAITTNDYLMLGTQLGIPGLACFLAYVALSLKSGKRKAESGNLSSAECVVRSCDAPVAEGGGDASSPGPAANAVGRSDDSARRGRRGHALSTRRRSYVRLSRGGVGLLGGVLV